MKFVVIISHVILHTLNHVKNQSFSFQKWIFLQVLTKGR